MRRLLPLLLSSRSARWTGGSRASSARACAIALLIAAPSLQMVSIAGCADREHAANAGATSLGGAAGGPTVAGSAGAAGSTPATGGTATTSATALAGAGGSPLSPDRDDPACLAQAEGIALSGASNPTGAPSFAFASCRLAYLAADGSLRDRDLLTGAEITLAPASAVPGGPTRTADRIAWDALTDAGRRVHVQRADGKLVVLPSMGKSAGEARIFGDDVVFTIFKTSADEDTDVALWEGATGEIRVLAEGPAQQRFPTVSRRYVAYADFREAGEQGHFDEYRASLADIVILDRATGEKTVRALPGKQAFPMLDPELDLLGYLQWDEVRPEPKLGAPYGIRVGSVLAPSLDREIRAPDDGTSVAELRPSLEAGRFAWLERHEDGLRVLSRAAAEGAEAVSHAVSPQALASSPLALGPEVWVSLRAPGQQDTKLTRLP